MLKRMSKVTSLLVASAAIISVIPANAVDYKKIDSQEGTIYNAVSYKNGKFYIDGEVNNQNESTYYLANGKYNNLSEIDNNSSVESYSSKYLNIQNGDYFIDLNSGSVTDNSIKSDSQDDTALALRKNIKKDTNGRYNITDAGTIKKLDGKELSGNKFTDLWYGVTYGVNKSTNGNASLLNVYTDEKGNYIDADYNLGSIKVTTNNGLTDKTITISNTNDKYDGAGSAKAISASVVSENSGVIGQDDNYIYRIAKITITSSTSGVSITKINGLSITGKSVFETSASGSVVKFNAIQKISKAQASDNINGAKYAKSVTTYVISKDNGDAINENLALNKYTISNGKIINYTIDSSSVKAETIVLSSKNGYYYTDVNDQSIEDVEVVNSKAAVDIDTNGNLWRLSKGYIYKWNNDEDWIKLYKVDGSFNQISVYDDNDIVVWNKENELYSVIGRQVTTAVETTPAVNKGWIKTNAGWTFYNATGTQVKEQWINDGGTWYYIKDNGIMATGWVKYGANWYFLNESGSMKTGWLNDNGTWYYLNSSGTMLTNTTVDGYKLGSSGAWIK